MSEIHSIASETFYEIPREMYPDQTARGVWLVSSSGRLIYRNESGDGWQAFLLKNGEEPNRIIETMGGSPFQHTFKSVQTNGSKN